MDEQKQGPWTISTANGTGPVAVVVTPDMDVERQGTREAIAGQLAAGLRQAARGRPIASIAFAPSPDNSWVVAATEALKTNPGLSPNVTVTLPAILMGSEVIQMHSVVRGTIPAATVKQQRRDGSTIVCEAGLLGADGDPKGFSGSCDFSTEDAEIRAVRKMPPIPYHPPGYTNPKRPLRPEFVPALSVWQLGHAQGMLLERKMISNLAAKYFLATALTEHHWSEQTGVGWHGMISGQLDYYRTLREDVNTVLGTRFQTATELSYAFTEATMDYVLSRQAVLLPGVVFGLVLDFKTGRFAEQATKGRTPTEAERVARWNGAGRAMTRIGLADANHHAEKVMALNTAIVGPAPEHTANLPLVAAFTRWGGRLFP